MVRIPQPRPPLVAARRDKVLRSRTRSTGADGAAWLMLGTTDLNWDVTDKHCPVQFRSPHPSKTCRVPGHALHLVPTHPLHVRGWQQSWNAALDDRRALGSRIKFADQSVAVEHQHALLDLHQLHPFPGQSLADSPFLSADIELALAVHLQHSSPRGILPRRRVRIVAARTGLPQRGRCLHPQSFMRSHMIVLPAARVRPGLPVLPARTAPLQGALQRAVKTFYLALGLGCRIRLQCS
jgi:hypothetical protein